jgi:hypothetical protein
MIDQHDKRGKPMLWLLRVVSGLLVAFCSLICIIGSFILILDPQSPNPLVAQTAGVVMALLCIWLLSIGVRLLFNKPNRGGLFSPLVLRLVAIYMVAMPIFIIVTGKANTWNVIQHFQGIFSIVCAPAVWRLASLRKASNIEH